MRYDFGMSDEKALLAAILANPDEDTPRLAYADWLQEHGDESGLARAEFIRLQCELARLDEYDPRANIIAGRCRELSDVHWQTWATEIGHTSRYPYHFADSYKRGFLDYICLDAEDLGTPELSLFLSRHPATYVFVRRVDKFTAELGDWSHLPRVKELSFSYISDEGEPLSGLRALLASPLLTSLRTLNLGMCGLADDDSKLIADNPRFVTLRRLELGFNALTDEGVGRIVESPYLHGLTAIDLSATRITPSLLSRLTQVPFFSRLDFLELSAFGRNRGDLTALQPDSIFGLLRSTQLARLSSLVLKWNRLGDRVVELITSTDRFAKLTCLELPENELGPLSAEQLLTSPSLSKLTELDLSNNQIGSTWIGVNTRCGLRQLQLENCGLTSDDAIALARCEALQTLRHLSLCGNPIGDRGAIALAQSPHLLGLRKLKLSRCGLSDEAALALATAAPAGRFRWVAGYAPLGLSGARLSPEVQRRIRDLLDYDPTSY
jgi:uncharacterized protein (TIGR02996 family)